MRGRRFAAAAALVLLLCGWSAAAARAPAARTTTSFAAAGCRSYGSITQTMSGRISGCLRIEALRPGPRTIVVQQLPNVPTKTPAAVLRRLKRTKALKRLFPHEPAASVTVSPSSGGPGTAVTITVRLRSQLPRRQLDPDICWDGCGIGLGYGAVATHRTSPRSFRTRIVVPAAPWIEANPVRVAPLVSGSYAIGLQCLLPSKGCDSSTEGAAVFHLSVPAQPAWCTTASSCARLKVTPTAGIPGDVVKVTGFAPLVSISGANQPFVFQFEVLRGRPHGPEVAFSQRYGVVNASFGRAALEVRPPPSFASQRDTAPIGEVGAGLPLISADPSDPSTVAWCALGAIGVSSAGATSSIPTAAAAGELTSLGFQVLAGQPLSCTGVAPLDTPAGSLSGIVAAFQTNPGTGGAPFFYDVALVTYDGGRSWSAVPAPPGTSLAGFGGLRYQGNALEAVFGASARDGTTDYPAFNASKPLAEIDSGGWHAAPLGCPATGPCVTIGPFFPGNCAMNEVTQELLRSTDGGLRWSQPSAPDYVQSCGEAELVATTAHSLLLANSMSEFPLVRSTDGGATWSDVGLPHAPNQRSSLVFSTGPGGITVLPDGGLLATADGRWELLAPRGRAWCRVRSPAPALQSRYQSSPVTVIGGQLWWLTGSPAGTGAITANQSALADLSC